VDDEEGVREAAADLLRELGYHVLGAKDGSMALRLLQRLSHLDLLVTDVGLHGDMNGRQLAEAACARWPTLPVLFITGYTEVALPSGAQFLTKPFRLAALAQQVQAILTVPG
jgi:DNA-binding response OmpR family regulator